MIRVNRDSIKLYFLFITVYFTAVRINGDVTRLPTFFLIIIPFLLAFFLEKISKKIILILFFFTFIFIFHALILDFFRLTPLALDVYFQDFILYQAFFIVYVFSFSKVNILTIEDRFIYFFKVLVIFSLFLWGLSFVSPVKVGVEINYSIPRAQAFLSEPSNMSHFLPTILLFSWLSRDWKWIILSLVCVVTTFSPTVFIVAALTFILYFLLKKNMIKGLFYIAFIFFFIALALTFIPIIFGENSMVSISIRRLTQGILYVFEDQSDYKNARADLTFQGFEFINNYNLWFSGLGIGSSREIGLNFNTVARGMLFDMSSWMSLLLWFGLIPTVTLFIIAVSIIIKLPDSFLKILAINMFISNSLNSGGIYYQIFFILVLIWSYRSIDNNYKIVKRYC